MDILEQQWRAHRERKPYALCILIRSEGTTPRSAGSKMLVFADGTIAGTVGGGMIERQSIEDALAQLETGGVALREYANASDELGPSCGGRASVYIEAFCDNAPRLIVCGAGHVGGAVIRLAKNMGYVVTAIDTRADEELSPHLRLADRFVRAANFPEGIAACDAKKAYFLISTYAHAVDGAALGAALRMEPSYVGMMGSAAKIAGIFKKLRSDGYSDAELASVRAPVGLDIGGETPDEIAVSILAEMQTVRYGKSGQSLCQLRKDSRL